ncbi:MAG: hypothetical protein WA988_21175 [Candidatus Nanopelagicales bacterium]
MFSVFRIAPKTAVAVVAVVAALGGLAACSSSSTDTPEAPASATTSANQQDAVFAKQLVELNEQLVSITDILSAKTDDPKALANLSELERIANERVILAKGWLQRWGRTAVEAPVAPGILTEQQLDLLIESNGKKLAAAIESVTQSQLEGTLEISQAEVSLGENTAAKQVAQQLIDQSKLELAVLNQVIT